MKTSRAVVAALVLAACDRCASEPAPAPSSSSSSAPAPSASSDPLASIRWDDAPIDWSRPVPTTPAGGVAEEGYVGSEACKPCHASLFASFARHSMARTGLRPIASLDKKWLSAIFDAGTKQRIVHERSGYAYRPLRDKDRFFVEETIADESGAIVHARRVEITHTLSAGRYGMALYFRQGTHVYQTPIAYYPTAQRFDLDPGAVEGNPRFSKPLETFCISCHSDYPGRRAGTDSVFVEPLPEGVGCERCHGPGAQHAKTSARADIVNPQRLPAARQLDVCAQCHESSASSLRAGRHDFGYRPGEPLDAYRVNFVSEPIEPDRFTLLAHAERMVASACWRGGKLTCTSCHDPHKSSFDQPDAWWDQKCNACHAERRCSADDATRATQKNHCVKCHMRAGAPNNPRLVSVTDHFIQKRPPPLRAGIGEPEKLVAWSTFVGESASGADLAALEAVAYAHAGRADASVRLAPALVEAGARTPQLFDWLAGKYRERKDARGTARAYAAVLRFEPDARVALFGYARAEIDLGGFEASAEAMRALDRMILLDPDDASALETKAILLVREGRVDDARPLFERAAAAGTTTAASHVALAQLAARAGRSADAIAELEAARRIEPSDPWIIEKLADAYTKANDRANTEAIARAKRFFGGRGASLTAATRWLPPSWR